MFARLWWMANRLIRTHEFYFCGVVVGAVGSAVLGMGCCPGVLGGTVGSTVLPGVEGWVGGCSLMRRSEVDPLLEAPVFLEVFFELLDWDFPVSFGVESLV